MAVAGVAVADTISQAAQRVLQCVSDALSDVLRPVCKVYQTVGVPVIASCCECDDEGSNGEVSIHLTRVYDADSASLDEVVRVRPCRGGPVAAQFRVTLARCFPTVDEHGEVPAPDVLEEYAEGMSSDAEILWQALTCCYPDRIRVDDISVDLGPMGGCSVIYADITIPVRIPAPGAGSG